MAAEPIGEDHTQESGHASPAASIASHDSAREAEYRELLSLYANDVVLLFDDEFRLLDCNECFPEVYGYSREELLALTLPDLRAPWNPISLEKRKAGVRERSNMIFESIHMRKDGSGFPVETSIRVIETESGSCYHATVRDITDRKQMEDALRESQEEGRDAHRLAHIGVWTWETESDTVTWTDELYRIAGLDPKLPAPAYAEQSTLYTPESWERLDTAVRRAVKTGEPYQVEVAIVRPDGSTRWVSTFGGATRDDLGRIESLYGTVQDVTERKAAEEALRALSARQEILLAAVPGIVMEVDSSRRYTWSNSAGIEFFGEDVIGKEAAFYFEGEQDTYDIVGRLFDGSEETIHVESWQWRKDGEKRLLAWRCRTLKDGDGSILGALSAALDITESKQAENEIRRLNSELEGRVISRTSQLEASNKELEAFAYSVSHDLRAPLRAIDGFSQIVIDDAAARLVEADVEHLQRVRKAAQRMAVLIDDLLGLSRVSRRDLLRRDVDLSAMATSILEELREGQPGRQVEVCVAPGMKATADPALLRVIFMNLLANAWKFTSRHENARIEVGVVDAERERVFFVRDDGAGFDPRYAKNLFGAFQRMHSSDQFEGNGIGLATVQRLVARHGGRVWAEAKVEKGATFFFTLPEPTATV